MYLFCPVKEKILSVVRFSEAPRITENGFSCSYGNVLLVLYEIHNDYVQENNGYDLYFVSLRWKENG